MAISFVKSFSTSIKSIPYDGYQSKIIHPETLSDTEDEDQSNRVEINDIDLISCNYIVHVKTKYKPEYGGPFYSLNSSMWPLDILSEFSQPEDSQPPYQIDEFGFVTEDDELDDKKEESEEQRREKNLMGLAHDNELKSKWISYLEFTYNDSINPKMKWSQIETQMKHNRVLDELMKMGIPNYMRPQIWMRMSSGQTLKIHSNWTYTKLCELSNHVPTLSDKHIIEVLPTNVCFMSVKSIGIERLRRILRVIKWLQKTGSSVFNMSQESVNLSLVTAYLLLICCEEEAFWLSLSIFNELKSFDHQELLETLIASYCPQVNESIKKHDIDLGMITSQWFSTLFASFIPKTKVLYQLWDLYFYFGSIVFFQLIIGLLIKCSDVITNSSDSAAVFNAISDMPSRVIDKDSLISIWTEGSKLVQHIGSFNNCQISGSLTSSLSLQSISSHHELNDLNDLKTKNIRQTSILVELHESIVAIAKHFEAHDSKLKANLIPDFDSINHDTEEDYDMRISFKHKRAKALVDFQRHDPDELGFRKNDIITIISENDEHCWVGEVNGVRGWFPAKFVEILNERTHDYSIAGDDRVTPFINDLVRGRLYLAFKSILSYGMKKTLFVHTHPWTIIESIANACIDNDFNSVYSRLVLTKTFRLDEFARVLTPSETLYRSMAYVNQTHENEAMDVKLRSLLCIALNQQILHQWFTVICSAKPDITTKWYFNWSFLNSPGWKMIQAELK